MVKKNWLLVLIVSALVFVMGIGFLVKLGLDRRGWEEIEVAFPDRGLPRINITLNGTTLEEIDGGSKEVKYEGNELSIYDGRSEVDEYEGVQVKGRGNGTWGEEKKPYQIRFRNKVDLFGMGKARKWILLANAMDKTNLRTEAAFYLEEMLGMEPAYTGEFVELYVDGDYRGLYYLTHAVEIGKRSVNLRDPLGVLVELDNVYGRMEEYYETKKGDRLVIKDVVGKDYKEEAMSVFLNDYNEFEKVAEEGDYEKANELADLKSFAQYYLLSEFTVNPDAYWTSFYMYKDGVSDKIHAGPGWDFDYTLSNKVWGNWMGEDFYSPRRTMVRRDEIMTEEMYEEMGLSVADGVDWYKVSLNLSRIMFNLMDIPEFQDLVRQLYVERMKGREDELIWIIENKTDLIEEAVAADEERWENEGFLQEVERMKEWISERYKYFDEVYGDEKVQIDRAL